MDQTKYIVMMTNEEKESTKIVDFITLEAGILMLGRGHIHVRHYSEYVLSSNLSIHSTLISVDSLILK